MPTLQNTNTAATSLNTGSFSVFTGLKFVPATINGKPAVFGWKGANRSRALDRAQKLMNDLYNAGNEIVYVLDENQVVTAQIYKRYIVQQKVGYEVKRRATQKITKAAMLDIFAGLDLQ